MPRASTAIVCPNTAPGFFAISPRTAQNGATIDFSQPTVLGLPNPFNLTGLTTAWEVMITVLYQGQERGHATACERTLKGAVEK